MRKPKGSLDPLLAPLAPLAAALAARSGARLDSAPGTLPACLLSALAPRQALVLVGDADAQAATVQDLRALAPEGVRVAAFPGPHRVEDRWLPLRWADSVSRLELLDRLATGEALWLVATPEAALTPVPARAWAEADVMVVAQGQELDRPRFLERLVELGYRRDDATTAAGQFSVRGGIVDVFPPQAGEPVRFELVGDEVESLRGFDPATQRSSRPLERVRIGSAREVPGPARLKGLPPADGLPDELEELWEKALEGDVPEGLEALLPWLPGAAGSLVEWLAAEAPVASFMSPLAASVAATRMTRGEPEGRDPWAPLAAALAGRKALELGGAPVLGGQPGLESGATAGPSWVGALDRFLAEMKEGLAEGRKIALACGEEGRLARLKELFDKEGIPVATELAGGLADRAVTLFRRDLGRGFRLPATGFQLVGSGDLWADRALRQEPSKTAGRGARFADWTELETGCLVVHVDHGIGRFLCVKPLVVDGMRQDFLELEYAEGDKLFVSTSQLDRVQRYIGVEGGHGVKLHRLSSTRWAQTRNKVREDAEKVAKELLELYAHRAAARGAPTGPDTVWQQELEAAFPYEDTPDQVRSLGEIKRDLERVEPMDRLLCGDVGFGKTEVAIRAAFKAVQAGLQVAVLAPTTVLAQQHYQTFSQRLSDFPVRLGVVSRLRDPKETATILRKAKTGELDVLIGTHRLLSKDVQFKSLGLLVIDEEQRFGVRHKERIKELKTSVHVLTLTATPIPRTLNLALSGARDISTIATPPRGRLAVKTFVQEYDDALVKGAVEAELDRGGQVFYVHNRIETLGNVVDRLAKLIPRARIRGGHAQMERHQLEKLMVDFYDHQYDVLVSTTIVENGLDIPNVNTIVVDRADKLGLAQLYQLRGRVGRTTRQAYAYLLYHPGSELTETAFKRLKALEDYTELGSGFRVAMRDLELRGAGSILGLEQHGSVNTVGFEMYTRLLREAVAKLKGVPEEAPTDPAQLELPFQAYLPEEYIPSYEARLDAYRHLAAITDLDELDDYRRELTDRYGPPPEVLSGVFRIVKLKIRATRLGIDLIRQKGVLLELRMKAERAPPTALVQDLLKRFKRQVRFHPDGFTLNVAGFPRSGVVEWLEKVLPAAEAAQAAGPPPPPERPRPSISARAV